MGRYSFLPLKLCSQHYSSCRPPSIFCEGSSVKGLDIEAADCRYCHSRNNYTQSLWQLYSRKDWKWVLSDVDCIGVKIIMWVLITINVWIIFLSPDKLQWNFMKIIKCGRLTRSSFTLVKKPESSYMGSIRIFTVHSLPLQWYIRLSPSECTL